MENIKLPDTDTYMKSRTGLVSRYNDEIIKSNIDTKGNVIPNVIIDKLVNIQKQIYDLDISLIDNLSEYYETQRMSINDRVYLEALCLGGRNHFLGELLDSIKNNNENLRTPLLKLFAILPELVSVRELTPDFYMSSEVKEDIKKAIRNKDQEKLNKILIEQENKIKNDNYYKNLRILSVGIGSVSLVTILLVWKYVILNSQSVSPPTSTSTPNNKTTSKPENITTPTPYIFTTDDVNTFILLSMWCYVNNKTGCFMVRDSSFILLDNCSSFYGTNNNMFFCSCGNISSSLYFPICDSVTECLKPYCLGNSKCSTYNTGITGRCLPDSKEVLYQCTNTTVGNPNYVYYTYINDSILSIISEALNLSSVLNNSQKFNILPYIIGVVFIIIAVIIVMKKLIK